jgi:hypothetical protein
MTRLHLPWARILFVGWMLLISFSYLPAFMPTWMWFEVREVHIDDIVVGETIHLEVLRTIRRPFRGTYTASVQKFEGDGWASYCAGTATALYDTDAVLPDAITLDWWTYPAQCQPEEAGLYRVKTQWLINAGLTVKEVRATSNTFEIKEASR